MINDGDAILRRRRRAVIRGEAVCNGIDRAARMPARTQGYVGMRDGRAHNEAAAMEVDDRRVSIVVRRKTKQIDDACSNPGGVWRNRPCPDALISVTQRLDIPRPTLSAPCMNWRRSIFPDRACDVSRASPRDCSLSVISLLQFSIVPRNLPFGGSYCRH